MNNQYFKERRPFEQRRIKSKEFPLMSELKKIYGGDNKMLLDFREYDKDILEQRIIKIDEAIIHLRATRELVIIKLKAIKEGDYKCQKEQNILRKQIRKERMI